LFKPWIVSRACSSPARTLIYALQYFRSGVTFTSTTLVMGWIRGSFNSVRMISLRAFCTSPLILVFLILSFLILLLLYKASAPPKRRFHDGSWQKHDKCRNARGQTWFDPGSLCASCL